MPNYYPIMLDVRGRPAVVIGGDAIAAEKAAALCACGARVTVISPTFCPQVQREGEQGRVTLRCSHSARSAPCPQSNAAPQ